MQPTILIQLQFLLTALFGLFISIGLGGVVSTVFRINFNGYSFGVIGAFGITALGALSLFVNFLFPLNLYFFIFLCALAVLGIFQLKRNYRNSNWKADLIPILVAIIAFWLIGLRRLKQSDTGLYHVPVIHWMHLSSLPLGLANVHTRFGNWNFWFSVCGGINAGEVLPLSVYSMNLVLFGLLVADLIRWIRDKANPAHYVSLALFFYFAVVDLWFFGGGQKSPDADYAGAMIAVWAFTWFLQRRTSGEVWVLPTILLSGLSVMIKLNQAPMVLLILIAAYFLFFKYKIKNGYFGFIFVFLSGMLLVLKSFWTSGCLVFPILKSCLPVSWRVPDEGVIGVYVDAARWARWWDGPVNEVLHGWIWVPRWWGLIQETKMFEILRILIPSFLIVLIVFRKKFPKMDLTTLLISLVGILYWFLTAPDLRFGIGYFFILFALLFSTLLQLFFESNQYLQKTKKYFVSLMLLLVLISMVGQIRKADDFGAATLLEPSPTYR